MDSVYTTGYSWTRNTISALFQPVALNGADNPARYVAIPAMFMYCISLAVIFRGISKSAVTKFHQKTIEIAGIGFAIYMFLIVTPMHNLMVTIALLFFLATVLSVLHNVYLKKNIGLFMVGIVCVSIPLINATLYYGNAINDILPIVQKTGALACAVWFFIIYYVEINSHVQVEFHLKNYDDVPR